MNSESEQDWSMSSSDCSKDYCDNDVKMQLLADENSNLRNDLARLKSQFSSAVDVKQELEKLHKENAELTSKLRSANLASDDLRRRLQLNISSYEEKITSLTNTTDQKLSMAHQDLADTQTKMKVLEERSTSEIQSLEAQLSLKDKKIEDLVLSQNAYQRKVEKLLKLSNDLYQRDFTSLDSLIAYTEAAQFASQHRDSSVASQADHRDTVIDELTGEKERLEKRISKMHKKQKDLKQQISEYKSTIEQNEYEKHESEKQAKYAVNKLKAKLKAKEDEFQRKIEILEKKIQQPVKRETPRPPDPTPTPPVECIRSSEELELQRQIKRNENTIECLKREIEDSKASFDEAVDARKQVETALRQTQNKIKDLESEIASKKREIESLTSRCQVAETEAKETHRKLLDLTSKGPESDVIDEKEREMNNKMKKAEKRVRDLQNRITKLSSERINIEGELERSKSEVNRKCEQISCLQRQVAELESKIRMTPVMEPPVQPRANVERQSIPISCYACPNAPPELALALKNIVSNSDIQQATKVQMVISTIANYYAKVAVETGRKMEQMKTENTTMVSSFTQLLHDINNIVEVPTSPNGLLNSAAERVEFAARIAAHQEMLTKIEYENHKFHEMCDSLLDSLGIDDYSKIENSVAALFSEIERQAGKINELTGSIKVQKKQKKAVIIKLSEENNTLKGTIKKLKRDNNDLIDSIATAKYEHRKCSSTIRHLHDEIDTLNDQLSSSKQEFQDTTESQKQETDHHIAQMQSTWQQEVSRRDAVIDQLNDQIELMKNEQLQAKKAFQTMKVKFTQASDEISELKQFHDSEKEQMRTTYEEQIKSINGSNNKLVCELQTQMSDLRAALGKMNQSLAAMDKKNRDLVNENGDVRRQNSKIKAQMASEREAYAREQKLLEARVKSDQLKLETKLASAIAEAKSDFEAEKHHMIAQFAEEFRAFFDPNEQIDMDTYQRIMRRASNELTSLHEEVESIKRITNALPNQSAQEAVSQLLLKSTGFL